MIKSSAQLTLPEPAPVLTHESRLFRELLQRCSDLNAAHNEVIGNRFSGRASWVRSESLTDLCRSGEYEREDLANGNTRYMPDAARIVWYYTNRYHLE